MKAAFLLAGVVSNLSGTAALTYDVSPPDPDKVALPVVPKVLDAGRSGFPELPSVSSMLDASSATLSSISSRAAELQQQMKAVEAKNAARLHRQKVVFDKKLREQEEKNVKVVKENAKFAKEILNLKKENEIELKQAKDLQKENALRQQQLNLLNEQLSTSQAFLANTMKVADDSKAKELEVLRDSDSTTDDSKQAPSFLSIVQSSSQEDNAADEEAPESLMSMLEAGIKDMKEQGKKSESKLKELFLSHFQAGVRRHKALMAQQDVLKTTIKSMSDYHTRLDVALKHLKVTQGTLSKSLHDASLFLKRLSQLSASKPEEGVKMLSELKSKEAKIDSAADKQ
eukprot:TRINITY_DN8730_c0_g1_i1.p1 TRINITY_DN8730_c0_g1~~TRINITY_DN8730_c0_g1_i1.p1  ORF type:complete len:342 (-),score=117.66 TRINITY_DN8730_c0_g1_i1:79-1104(-)